jgi:hypothetical protein
VAIGINVALATEMNLQGTFRDIRSSSSSYRCFEQKQRTVEHIIVIGFNLGLANWEQDLVQLNYNLQLINRHT